MGCGASKQHEKSRGGDTYEIVVDDDEEDRQSTKSNQSTKSVNKFTTEYASKVSPKVPYYTTANEEDLPWKRQLMMQDASPTIKAVEDFVFGDFKVDPNDVNVQRRERINRRRASTTVRPVGPTGNGSGKTMTFNDFIVKIDDVDDFAGGYEEKPLPKGFRRLHKFHITTLSGHSSRVKTVAIAPHERVYVSASMEDSSIALYNTETGEEITSFVAHQSPIIAACFSRDGKYMATSSRDNMVIVWDVASTKESSKKLIRSFAHDSLPICCTFSHDGVYLITGCQNKICIVWDIARSELCFSYSEHEGVVVCIASHMEESLVATGGGDKVIRLWDITTGQTVRPFIGHDGVVISLSFTPDNERLLSNDDRACKMWKVETGACVLNVTLDSLSKAVNTNHDAPKPLSRAFYEKHKIRPFGLGVNGILGPQALNACRIAAHRTVFTLSCLCPGELANSYFAVASTNKMVYLVSQVTGKEEISFMAKSAVFAIASGRGDKLIFGDIFGNIYRITLTAPHLGGSPTGPRRGSLY